MEKKKDILSETIINGCRVYVEDGEVKTQLSEEIEKQGWMDVDTFFDLLQDEIKKIYKLKRCNKMN